MNVDTNGSEVRIMKEDEQLALDPQNINFRQN